MCLYPSRQHAMTFVLECVKWLDGRKKMWASRDAKLFFLFIAQLQWLIIAPYNVLVLNLLGDTEVESLTVISLDSVWVVDTSCDRCRGKPQGKKGSSVRETERRQKQKWWEILHF